MKAISTQVTHMFFFLLLSSASAFATTIPVMGVLVNIDPDDSCKAEILGVVPPGKAAAITEGVLSAQADCFAKKSEAQADVITAKAHAASEYVLAKATAKAVETGDNNKNVSFKSGDLEFETGPHLNFKAFAESAMYGNGLAPGMPLGYTNPEGAMLWRLASTEAAFASAPQIPAGVVTSTATSKEPKKDDDKLKKELEETKAQLEAKSKLLEERDAKLAKQGS